MTDSKTATASDLTKLYDIIGALNKAGLLRLTPEEVRTIEALHTRWSWNAAERTISGTRYSKIEDRDADVVVYRMITKVDVGKDEITYETDGHPTRYIVERPADVAGFGGNRKVTGSIVVSTKFDDEGLRFREWWLGMLSKVSDQENLRVSYSDYGLSKQHQLRIMIRYSRPSDSPWDALAIRDMSEYMNGMLDEVGKAFEAPPVSPRKDAEKRPNKAK